MRILFAASPAIAVPALKAVYGIEGIELAGVLTNPDTPKGRHGVPAPTEIGEAAQKLNIAPVLKPLKLDSAAREQIGALKCDLLVSFACGHFFGPKFLALFPMGGINIHPSLLPKYRGPSPIQTAILNRDIVTGISIQTLADKMDCGDIIASEQIQLTGRETTASLGEIAAQKAAVMLPDVLKKIADGSAEKTAQNHNEATHCKLFVKNDGIINWGQSAAEIDAKIRAFNPWPLCSCNHNGRELFILESDIYSGSENAAACAVPGKVLGTDKNHGILIQTGDGILAVTRLQYQAKKALFWRDFLNGARDFLGSQL
ncbi:MAG: methionyl-tRNA formyltransferase [Treponema sp.]|nr:methionyl-tRNA formyltransferase [Treponema sp.]